MENMRTRFIIAVTGRLSAAADSTAKVELIEELSENLYSRWQDLTGSGASEEGFRQSIQAGIRKINYYSYMSKAGYLAAKAEIEKNASGYLHDVEYAAMHAMKEDVKAAIKTFSRRG